MNEDAKKISDDEESFPQNPKFMIRIWHEIEPIVVHASVTLVLMSCLVLILFLVKIFPLPEELQQLLIMVDYALIVVLLTIFSVYTIALLILRSWKIAINKTKKTEKVFFDKVSKDISERIKSVEL